MPPVTSSKDIIQHIFLNLHSTISPEDYDILKDFPKPEHSRHSMVIKFKVVETKKAILEECKKFKNLDVSHPLRFVYIKHDMSPLTKKENARIYKTIRELRDLYQGDNQMEVKLKYGKLYVNDEIVDEFSISNQIF